MATYIIKTYQDRNIFVEADSFELDSGFYNFYNPPPTSRKRSILVGSVPAAGILGVFEFEDAYQDDFYDHSELEGGEDETDDVCSECRAQELVGTHAFIDAVFDQIDYVLNQDTPPEAEHTEYHVTSLPATLPEHCGDTLVVKPVPVPETPVAVPDPEPLAKVEYRSYREEPTWGMTAEGRFIPFWDKDTSIAMSRVYYVGQWRTYVTEPIEDCPLVEVPSE